MIRVACVGITVMDRIYYVEGLPTESGKYVARNYTEVGGGPAATAAVAAARLGAQVVSGIGFLGAGAIMKEGVSVTGLTTAACLWVVACVGLAVGAGFYIEAIMTTILVVIVVGVLSHFELKKSTRAGVLQLTVYSDNNPEQLSIITSCLDDLHIDITKIKMREEYARNEREQTIILVMEMMLLNSRHYSTTHIVNILQDLPGIHGIELR